MTGGGSGNPLDALNEALPSPPDVCDFGVVCAPSRAAFRSYGIAFMKYG